MQEITLTLEEADKELIDEFSANPDKTAITADGLDEVTVTATYNKN